MQEPPSIAMTDQRADADGGRRAGAGSVLNPLAQQNRNASVATSATASTLMSPSRRLFFAGHANATVIKAELLERLVFKALWLFALCTLFISANLVATARNSHQASFLTYVVKDVLTGDHRIDGLRGFEDRPSRPTPHRGQGPAARRGAAQPPSSS